MILSLEDNRLDESSEKEIMFRISDIRNTFEDYVKVGLLLTSRGIFYILIST